MQPDDIDLVASVFTDSLKSELDPIAARVKALEDRAPVPGPAGKDGQPGIDGKDGSDGLAGKDGRDGIDGKDGAAGLNGKDAEVPPALLTRLEAFEWAQADQLSTADVLSAVSDLLRKEWAPILSPAEPTKVLKRVLRDANDRIVGLEETRP